MEPETFSFPGAVTLDSNPTRELTAELQSFSFSLQSYKDNRESYRDGF